MKDDRVISQERILFRDNELAFVGLTCVYVTTFDDRIVKVMGELDSSRPQVVETFGEILIAVKPGEFGFGEPDARVIDSKTAELRVAGKIGNSVDPDIDFLFEFLACFPFDLHRLDSISERFEDGL